MFCDQEDCLEPVQATTVAQWGYDRGNFQLISLASGNPQLFCAEDHVVPDDDGKMAAALMAAAAHIKATQTAAAPTFGGGIDVVATSKIWWELHGDKQWYIEEADRTMTAISSGFVETIEITRPLALLADYAMKELALDGAEVVILKQAS